MNTNPNGASSSPFTTLDPALERIRSLRQPVARLQTRDGDLAKQLRRARHLGSPRPR